MERNMMPNENGKLFFLSCVSTNEEIKNLKKDERVISIYHVCGVNPWLMVCSSDSFDDLISMNHEYHQLNIKYISIARPIALANRKKEVAYTTDKITFWVFIKGICKKEFESFINNIVDIYEAINNIVDIYEVYEIFGEYNFIVKLYTSNINGIDDFLGRCREKGLSTSTKCILSIIKENGRIIYDNIDIKKDRARKAKSDINYAIARIMTNTKDFIQRNKADQIKLLKDRLVRLDIALPPNIDSFILDPDTTKRKYFQDDLVHPNNLIDRYSVKLNRNNWLKVLLFFKAAHGKRNELEEILQEMFLGVTPMRFARKLYYITGDYDFFIPLDCSNIDELTALIEKFWERLEQEKKDLVTSFTNTICHPSEVGVGEGPLDVLDIPFIEALLINATQMNTFEERIRSEAVNAKIFLPILERKLEGKLLVPTEEGISPREDYVRAKLSDKSRAAIEEYIKWKFKSFADIGLESTIEFKDGALIQILTKFYFRALTPKEMFLRRLKEKIENNEIIATCYEPIRDPQTVMCILMIKDLVELEVLFEEMIEFCNKIEFHIIFHQTYYSKVIEKNIRCKPCFYPFKPQRGCREECNMAKWETCKDSKKCVIQKCGSCIRYILPRTRNQILNIDFKKTVQQKIKITVVGVDLSLLQYFILENSLDQEGYRNKIFENYKIFEKRKKAEENDGGPYGNSQSIFNDYERSSANKYKYRKEYKDAIESLLNQILDSEYSQIIIFPEYAIPLYIYDEIRKKDIKMNCVIIAGSHIDDDFNVCPIIFNYPDREKEIYHYYKNNFSELENYLGLITNRGTAYLKFLNTIVGNLYIQVCFDAYTVSEFEIFEKVDVSLVPSFNPSSKFIGPLESKAHDYKLVVAYANTINDNDAIKSNFFLPPNNGLNRSLRGIKPFHEDMWQGKQLTKENIFDLTEEKLNINGFNFTVKHLIFDIIQLDMRRTITI